MTVSAQLLNVEIDVLPPPSPVNVRALFRVARLVPSYSAV